MVALVAVALMYNIVPGTDLCSALEQWSHTTGSELGSNGWNPTDCAHKRVVSSVDGVLDPLDAPCRVLSGTDVAVWHTSSFFWVMRFDRLPYSPTNDPFPCRAP